MTTHDYTLVRVFCNDVLQNVYSFIDQGLLAHFCFVLAVMSSVTPKIKTHDGSIIWLTFQNSSKSCKTLGGMSRSMEAEEYMPCILTGIINWDLAIEHFHGIIILRPFNGIVFSSLWSSSLTWWLGNARRWRSGRLRHHIQVVVSFNDNRLVGRSSWWLNSSNAIRLAL